MTNITEKTFDKILAKTIKSVKNNKPNILTDDEMRLIDNTQISAFLIIKRLVTEKESQVYQIACFRLLEQALCNLRYNYERNETWAKKLYVKIDQVLTESLPNFPHDCIASIMSVFYDARLDIPPQFHKACISLLSDDDLGNSSELSMEEMGEQGQMMIESFFEGNENLSVFDLSHIIFSSLNGIPEEAIGSIIVLLAASPRAVAREACVLFLLHPKKSVREITIEVLSEIYKELSLPPISLSRLVTIRQWSPTLEQGEIDKFIVSQRKMGNEFANTKQADSKVTFKASLFDGTGVQMIFCEIKSGSKLRLGGFLVKCDVGIRDAWLSPLNTSKKEVKKIKQSILNETKLPVFDVDQVYVSRITSHYLALNNANNETPEPDFLEVYECLGINTWQSNLTSFDALIPLLIDDIHHGAPSAEWLEKSFARSAEWMTPYGATSSWFEQRNSIDALINRHTSIESGGKKISFESALEELTDSGFEEVRTKWMELFTWMALMTKANSDEAGDFLWFDFAALAFALNNGSPMSAIPLMQHMIHDSLACGMESLNERGTQLQQVTN